MSVERDLVAVESGYWISVIDLIVSYLKHGSTQSAQTHFTSNFMARMVSWTQ